MHFRPTVFCAEYGIDPLCSRVPRDMCSNQVDTYLCGHVSVRTQMYSQGEHLQGCVKAESC